jgi:hypothetical protein
MQFAPVHYTRTVLVIINIIELLPWNATLIGVVCWYISLRNGVTYIQMYMPHISSLWLKIISMRMASVISHSFGLNLCIPIQLIRKCSNLLLDEKWCGAVFHTARLKCKLI